MFICNSTSALGQPVFLFVLKSALRSPNHMLAQIGERIDSNIIDIYSQYFNFDWAQSSILVIKPFASFNSPDFGYFSLVCRNASHTWSDKKFWGKGKYKQILADHALSLRSQPRLFQASTPEFANLSLGLFPFISSFWQGRTLIPFTLGLWPTATTWFRADLVETSNKRSGESRELLGVQINWQKNGRPSSM